MFRKAAFVFAVFVGAMSILYSQNVTLRGEVYADDNIRLAGKSLRVHCVKDYVTTIDSTGFKYTITFPLQKSGTYKVVFEAGEYVSRYEIYLKAGAIINHDVEFRKIRRLREAGITGETGERGFVRFKRDVEGTLIYAGKKNNVILLDNLTINKATNNTRQIFGTVAGIIIHESNDNGLQLNIGSRGLDPNRTANFSVRQNGYDISADPLGYPESYYTPNSYDIEKIEILRGASALQYGSQFGGMINFIIAEAPADKKISLSQNLSYGSYNYLNSYTRISGTYNKWSYYLSCLLKKGDGYRKNSDFRGWSILSSVKYRFNDYDYVRADLTKFYYGEHQPGGLTDKMFLQDPRQSNRRRNWFMIDWNIAALKYHKEISGSVFDLNMNFLYAERYALGHRDKRVSTPDPETVKRDLQKGYFINYCAEARFLKRFSFNGSTSSVMAGLKYYQSANRALQGAGSSSHEENYTLEPAPLKISDLGDMMTFRTSEYKLPNFNLAFFSEGLIRISPKFSIIPGIRLERIVTRVKGETLFYEKTYSDGIPAISVTPFKDDKVYGRNVLLAGISSSYKTRGIEIYSGITQNYRAVTFNDMKTIVPAMKINPDLQDEKGFSTEIGIRSKNKSALQYDFSLFALFYGKRIGEYFREDPESPGTFQRYRDNVGDGLSYGLEGMLKYDFSKLIKNKDWRVEFYGNCAFTGSKYLSGMFRGNSMEFVPLINLKGGMDLSYKKVKIMLQSMCVSYQYTDAGNEPMNPEDNVYGIYGAVPGYFVADLNVGYDFTKHVSFELAMQNLTNSIYMTRRATGYPGPGIIPSLPFNVTATIKFKI